MQNRNLLLKFSAIQLCQKGSYNACRREQMHYGQWLQKHCHFHLASYGSLFYTIILQPKGTMLQLTVFNSSEITRKSVPESILVLDSLLERVSQMIALAMIVLWYAHAFTAHQYQEWGYQACSQKPSSSQLAAIAFSGNWPQLEHKSFISDLAYWAVFKKGSSTKHLFPLLKKENILIQIMSLFPLILLVHNHGKLLNVFFFMFWCCFFMLLLLLLLFFTYMFSLSLNFYFYFF